jgi:hypothetical protein
VRANPPVRAVLEGFGARLLSVERVAPAAVEEAAPAPEGTAAPSAPPAPPVATA